MAHFHICYAGHDCGSNSNKENLREVGERIVFAVNQFKESVAETLTVRIVQGA